MQGKMQEQINMIRYTSNYLIFNEDHKGKAYLHIMVLLGKMYAKNTIG